MQPNHLLRVIGLCVCVFASAQAFAQGFLDGEPTGRSDDLLARVTFENGEPVSGIRAEVQIKRTVGMFTGSGTPPITSYHASSQSGELRFPEDPHWRDWIKLELAHRNPKKPKNELDQADFHDFQWKLDGYWPLTNTRIEFVSSGKPALWKKNETIDFVIPQLQRVRIVVKSDMDNKPLANVRLTIREFRNRPQKRLWNDINAYAWTDATGSAVVWLPKGDYRVLWDPTIAIAGYAAASDLFLIQDSRFGPLPLTTGSRNSMVDQPRKEAFTYRSGFFNDYQAPLLVGDVAPEIYELKIQAPIQILP